MEAIIGILSRVPVWVLVALASACVIIGDFAAKSWSIDRTESWYWLALLGYLGSGFFYVPTLLREGLVVTSIAWCALSIIGFLVIGLIVFKETLSPFQIIGVALGILSIVILTLAD